MLVNEANGGQVSSAESTFSCPLAAGSLLRVWLDTGKCQHHMLPVHVTGLRRSLPLRCRWAAHKTTAAASASVTVIVTRTTHTIFGFQCKKKMGDPLFKKY